MTPGRGEVWLVDFGTAASASPALVIGVLAEATDASLVTVVPHTSSTKPSRFEAVVSVPFLDPGAFDAQNLVTLPQARLVRALGKLGPGQMAVVERAVCLWLGLRPSRTED